MQSVVLEEALIVEPIRKVEVVMFAPAEVVEVEVETFVVTAAVEALVVVVIVVVVLVVVVMKDVLVAVKES